jgi:hypothetical protein
LQILNNYSMFMLQICNNLTKITKLWAPRYIFISFVCRQYDRFPYLIIGVGLVMATLPVFPIRKKIITHQLYDRNYYYEYPSIKPKLLWLLLVFSLAFYSIYVQSLWPKIKPIERIAPSGKDPDFEAITDDKTIFSFIGLNSGIGDSLLLTCKLFTDFSSHTQLYSSEDSIIVVPDPNILQFMNNYNNGYAEIEPLHEPIIDFLPLLSD